MMITTMTATRKTKEAQKRDSWKINKKFKNHDVFCQILYYFIFHVHLPPGVYYKILSAFDALRRKLCSKNRKVI